MESQSEAKVPQKLNKRNVTIALILGLLGGVIGSFLFIRYAPDVIPISKQSVILQQNSAIIDVVKKVSPSVVSITSQSTGTSFFGHQQTAEGAGTGIIVSSDGLIITNNHVISGADTLAVFTSDGKEYKDAHVVARDTQNDLAFVRISASGLKPAEIGDSSSVAVGTPVVAIGNALGQFQNTVTQGIISGKGRPVTAGDELGGDTETLANLFQTDAAINPGNSGGPLVDLTGKVIAINTAVAGNAQNIGFAIPINQAKSELASVKSSGKIVKPYMGVRYLQLTKDIASQNNLSVSSGAYIQPDGNNPGIVPGGPADKAGLKEGDIITKVEGQSIDDSHPLNVLISGHKVGDKVTVTYIRDGKEQTTSLTLAEAPAS